MSVAVFIDGAAGTTGLEIRERLAGRPEVSLITLGETERKDAVVRREALNDADIVILCLPDEAAREAVALIDGPAKVIDASTAHRVAGGWTYGFPELSPDQAERIAGATRVANPGCYPTAFLALVAPLVRTGLIPADWPLSFNATSGYSGGGKAMIAEFEGGETTTGYRIYGLTLGHKHAPEMRLHAGLAHAPVFQPAVARSYRGMLGEVPLALAALPGRPTLDAITTALREAYAGSPVVTVADADEALVLIEEHAGTDRMTLRVFGNPATGHARLVATLDNLGKGAAGAAVQNLNIMAGLPQTAGLVL
ncbi:N-acetyl-gamma-glutamyl-phosphate reductase [Sphingomonas bacterium]|uniref:N-acetyl-gamma-glutamyl-phosphate reductase n=1 Tax=Sphingomonas bacterium TaxID=1895847 RepID=UPI00157688DD|nr:N-acetyl-gamma-glutamyl-phosphate reductase [Sphingomonas bacterium]